MFTPLTFAQHCLSPLAAFPSGAYFLHNGTLEGGGFVNFTLLTLKTFLEAHSQNVSGNKQKLVAHTIGCPKTRDLLIYQKTMQRHFFPTLNPLSPVIFVTAGVVAFLLLCNSRFNFHCYTQHEATPTQKSARKCTATSRDFLHERLQSAFTLPNQLR